MFSSSPFFTIITATFNAAQTLPRLLESLAAQMCRDFELVVQDGGSSDETLAVLESYRARLPSLCVESLRDSGIYDAWNKALPRISGKWVLFLGADDTLFDSEALRRCKEFLEPAPEKIRYAVGGVALCNASGKAVMMMPGEVEGVEAHLPKGHAPFWQNGLFHHASLFNGRCFDTSFRIFGDYDFICRTWSDDTAIHLPVTVSAITLGGVSNSPTHLCEARLEALKISQRYFSPKYIPGLLLAVAKAGIAAAIYRLLGERRGIKALNALREMRGLPPTWSAASVEDTASMQQGGNPVRKLNDGYLYYNKAALAGCKVIDGFFRLLPLSKQKPPENIRTVLLIKPDHLGDVFLMGSVLPLIKKRYPACAIDIVAGSWSRPVSTALPDIREVFFVDHWMLNRDSCSLLKKFTVFFRTFFTTLKTLRKRKYDLCLCLRSFGGNLISLGKLSGAAYLVGHGTGGLGPLLDAEATWHEGVHETRHFMEVLSLCGIPPVDGLHYPLLNGCDNERLEKQKKELEIGDAYTVIFPCSGDSSKMFDASYWKGIMAEAPEMLFVIVAGPNEREEASRFRGDLSNVILAPGYFAVPDLVEFLRGAVHIHAVDSFGAHLAGASGAPTTIHCLPGGADMIQFGPLGDNVRWFYPEKVDLQ